MKKLVFLVVAALLIVSLAGCGDGKKGGTDNNTNGGGNDSDTAQWAAYSFGDTVKPSSGGSGKIKSFTIDTVYTEDNKTREFTVEGTYLGTEMAQVATQKMVTSTTPPYISTTNVTTSLECYKIKHRVTVVKDETGGTHPAWADLTVWIPTDNFGTSVSYFWIYPKATYADSDGHTGEWSYYLTDAMKNDTTASYLPVATGDFYGYDGWMLYGLYGWGYYWFQAYTEGGQQQLRVASWSYGGCSFTCTKGPKTIGSYTFTAWTLDASCSGQGYSGGYKGIFSKDLPLPLYFKVGSSGDGTSNYWENTLTALQLQ